MGPWAHAPSQRQVGARDFGPAAEIDLAKLQRDWFGYWLQDQATGVEDWPPVKLFVMGENRWRDEQQWPLARTQWTPWYLHSQGHARTKRGDGRLDPSPPADEPIDTYTYDPEDPVPTTGGNNLVGAPIGPFDQAEVEERDDVLVYSSEPLSEPMEVTGPIKARLFVSTSAVDTDFTAKLVDVDPEGKAWNICDGIARLRYRDSDTDLRLATPGEVYELEIDLGVTSNLFLTGHRLRLEVSSSNFPRFDRNLNTAGEPGTESAGVVAQQTVWHDAVRPSQLILPIIPREPSSNRR
jgi:putative CocE/NonD family hydrolase